MHMLSSVVISAVKVIRKGGSPPTTREPSARTHVPCLSWAKAAFSTHVFVTNAFEGLLAPSTKLVLGRSPRPLRGVRAGGIRLFLMNVLRERRTGHRRLAP